MAELIIVTGPPGAGKTTVARALSGTFEHSALVVGDDFFGFIDRGYLDPWTAPAHVQNEIVVGAAAAAAGRFAAGGYTVVYDGVIDPWFVDAFARASGLTRLHYALLLPPEQLCLRRVESRVGHGFSDLDAARRMYARFATRTSTPVMSSPHPTMRRRSPPAFTSSCRTTPSCARSSAHRPVPADDRRCGIVGATGPPACIGITAGSPPRSGACRHARLRASRRKIR